jgi:hypothetical protein
MNFEVKKIDLRIKLISLLLDNELIASNFDVKFFDIKI